MSQQSAFNRKSIEESELLQQPGLLEQLNVPPKAIKFIRRNQRTIWIVVICVSLVVTAVSLYGTYRSYREEQASSALTKAMKAEGAEKKELLDGVVNEYGSTSAGMWGKIEIAHMAQAEGDVSGAIKGLTEVKESVAEKNPVTPLLVYNLGMLYEKNSNLDQALSLYNELQNYKGFEKIAYRASGRIYEQQGNRDKALDMYKKYMEAAAGENGQQETDPYRNLIQSRINILEG